MGVGWWQYQATPGPINSFLWRKTLSHKFIHSVRDEFTLNQLKAIGLENTLNTACPSMWSLPDNSANIVNSSFDYSILTLTDYNRSPSCDLNIIKHALTLSKKIAFFPQAPTDLSYFLSLTASNNISNSNFLILKPNLQTFSEFISANNCFYIGTRLHAAIFCIEHSLPAILISIDNRMRELASDTKMLFIERDQYALNLPDVLPSFLSPEIDNLAIRSWKSQFDIC